jgi:hypothetical protein
MEVECFDELAKKIVSTVGDNIFKSELYLDKMRTGMVHESNSNMDYCHLKSTGGFILGELKLALTWSMLEGGSHTMDLSLLFETSFSTSNEIFHSVIKEWIHNDNLLKINGFKYFEDDVQMCSIASE